jgi:hypothetical protein
MTHSAPQTLVITISGLGDWHCSDFPFSLRGTVHCTHFLCSPGGQKPSNDRRQFAVGERGETQSTMDHRGDCAGKQLAMEHHWGNRCTMKHREANELAAEHCDLSGLKSRKDRLRCLDWEGKNWTFSIELPFHDGWKDAEAAVTDSRERIMNLNRFLVSLPLPRDLFCCARNLSEFGVRITVVCGFMC